MISTQISIPRNKTFALAFSAVALVVTVGSAVAAPWSFGIISDTQWKSSSDGRNPN
jgi:hypothetical protein